MKNQNTQLSLLSMSKAAEMLSIGKTSLANLMAQGKIGFILINQRRKIAFAELERFIKENTYYNTTVTDPPIWSEEVSISNKDKHLEFDSTELFNKLKGDILNG